MLNVVMRKLKYLNMYRYTERILRIAGLLGTEDRFRDFVDYFSIREIVHNKMVMLIIMRPLIIYKIQ